MLPECIPVCRSEFTVVKESLSTEAENPLTLHTLVNIQDVAKGFFQYFMSKLGRVEGTLVGDQKCI